MFIDVLCEETMSATLRNKRKVMQKKDLDAALNSVDAFQFLDGALASVLDSS